MRRPPILFSRPAYEWINQVSQKHKRLAGLQLSQGRRDELKRWAEAEFVASAMRLENKKAPDETPAAAETLRALREIESVVEAAGREAALTPELIALLAGPREGEAGQFRKGPAAVENACRWFAADSFGELNPIEQAAIACLRFLEIEPFERKGERIALLSASLFTLRGTLPPVIIKPDQAPAFRAAVEEGFRMNTKPMVEVVGEAVTQSLDEMIRMAEA